MITLRKSAGKVEFLDGFDSLLEEMLSGVAEQGQTIVYGKSRLEGNFR